MKLNEYGLWFKDVATQEWSKSIPSPNFNIYFDGRLVGIQCRANVVAIAQNVPHQLIVSNLKVVSPPYAIGAMLYTKFDRPITIDDISVRA